MCTENHVCFGSTYLQCYVTTYVRTFNINVMSQLSDWKRAHMCTENYVCTYNVMSQLSDWKRAHMCTENHVCLRTYYTCTYSYFQQNLECD
jgi:hypothetical protein